ncbi:unknown protein [Seminavis robusta]|uniref:Uncharacterized protein n=1 Tax=Seminavis robusta TaxID=568900 RepID=A0A9N8E9R7_9STRA|nr:unknown protein [Seminavis robusta]|eukprot:Sro833_g208570.1 n/a (252) ;mRNA; r:32090-32845
MMKEFNSSSLHLLDSIANGIQFLQRGNASSAISEFKAALMSLKRQIDQTRQSSEIQNKKDQEQDLLGEWTDHGGFSIQSLSIAHKTWLKEECGLFLLFPKVFRICKTQGSMNALECRSCLIVLLYNLGLAYDLQAKSGPVGATYKCMERAIFFYQAALEAAVSTDHARSVAVLANMKLVLLATINNLARLESLQLCSEGLNTCLDWAGDLLCSTTNVPLEEDVDEDYQFLLQSLGPSLQLDAFVLPAAPAA